MAVQSGFSLELLEPVKFKNVPSSVPLRTSLLQQIRNMGRIGVGAVCCSSECRKTQLSTIILESQAQDGVV